MSYWLALQKRKIPKERREAFRKAIKLCDFFILDALEQLGVSVKPAEDLSVHLKMLFFTT